MVQDYQRQSHDGNEDICSFICFLICNHFLGNYDWIQMIEKNFGLMIVSFYQQKYIIFKTLSLSY